MPLRYTRARAANGSNEAEMCRAELTIMLRDRAATERATIHVCGNLPVASTLNLVQKVYTLPQPDISVGIPAN